MTPIERRFHKEYGSVLIRLAEEDLKAAIALHSQVGIRPELTIFHAEQVVEKCLKGVLCHQGIPVPMVHDLLALLQKLPPEDLPPGGFELHDLTPYATVKRYEEGMIVFAKEEIQGILSTAEKVLAWAKRKLAS